ncbi:TIGR01459 family HAD-type hydrolase [Acuticoccus sp. MNP-M23]|uniref:TIGR01459 family HAD-type hydrolase n=1 Tax=Acuticoccus sp. MNP-M23 TaxID=3072793 RepID=UPI002815F344|nr:TIGR01459 family HAD-type hydrolase [Acuticoccus sp. MNP-M23]WMS43864.1 TIGR01459 family HAD-type hydrolase [Acuticoccus sp. MNP-M23]
MTDAPISGLSAIADDYDAILCDVWGVLHNGVAAHDAASDALARFRQTGKPVVLLTNAPRPSGPVIDQLMRLGALRDAFDTVVSSGDVVRQHLIDEGFRRVYHLGPSRDLTLYDGTAIELVNSADEADAIVGTDMRSDDEVPADYSDEIAALSALSVPFICANPDIVVERGGDIVYCGGALAKIYEDMGGMARQFGKPHAPIYKMALGRIAEIAPDAKRVLAIGDGLPTDITGANRQGLDVLFITNGIHVHELGENGVPDPAKVRERLGKEGLSASHFIAKLGW